MLRIRNIVLRNLIRARLPRKAGRAFRLERESYLITPGTFNSPRENFGVAGDILFVVSILNPVMRCAPWQSINDELETRDGALRLCPRFVAACLYCCKAFAILMWR